MIVWRHVNDYILGRILVATLLLDGKFRSALALRISEESTDTIPSHKPTEVKGLRRHRRVFIIVRLIGRVYVESRLPRPALVRFFLARKDGHNNVL